MWCQVVKILSFILGSSTYDFDSHAHISGCGNSGLASSHTEREFLDITVKYSTAPSFHTLPFYPMWSELLALYSSTTADRYVCILSYDLPVSVSVTFTVNKICVMPLTCHWDNSDWPVVAGNLSVGFDRELSPREGTTGRQACGDYPASPASGLDRFQ